MSDPSNNRAWRPRRLPPAVIALAALVTVCAHAVGAQPATDSALTASATPLVLRRLAEVLDGHRTGGTVWIALGRAAPHPALGVFATRAAALQALRDSVGRFTLHGPLAATRDPIASDGRQLVLKCQHYQSAMHAEICPPGPQIDFGSVERMELTIRTRDGRTHILPLDPRADAIFLTLSAVEKFAMPYYAGVLGVESAAALRQRIITAARPASATGTAGRPPQ